MTRSNGIFPTYERLEIDPESPPGNYWVAGTLVCSGCQKRWPNHTFFRRPTSLCCNVELNLLRKRQTEHGDEVDEVPEMTWRQAISELFHYDFDQFYNDWNEGTSDSQLLWTSLSEEEQERIVHRALEEIDTADPPC